MTDQPKHPIVHVACRRGSDVATAGQSCNSTSAEKLSPDGALSVMFRCIQCGHTWSVAVGGTFNMPFG